MIRYSNAGKSLVIGMVVSLLLSFLASVTISYFLSDFNSYLDLHYRRIFWADAAICFPFCFSFIYLIFLLIFASTVLPYDISDPDKILNKVLFSVWLFLVLALLGFFFLIPVGNFVKERAMFRSSVAVDSLTKFADAYRERKYEEAFNFLKIYESVDENHDARFSVDGETVSFVFVHRRKKDFPSREYWLNSVNMADDLEALLNAQNEKPVKSTDNDYALKKLAYEKYSFGKENHYYQPIAEAYRIFTYLESLYPDDSEIGLHRERAEKEIRRYVLVKDRIREECVFPLSRNICFVNIENENVRQVVFARSLISLTGRDLVETVRIETVLKDGRKSVLISPYGRIEKDRILFDSVWLSDPCNVSGGEFTEGEADEWINTHYVPLYIPAQLLPNLDAENRDLRTVSFFDLIRLNYRFPEELEIASYYEREILVRLIRLVFVILAPFLMLCFGIRLAPSEGTDNSGIGYLFLPVIPVVCIFFFAVYWFGGLAASACILLFPDREILKALPFISIILLTLLLGIFVYSYRKRVR